MDAHTKLWLQALVRGGVTGLGALWIATLIFGIINVFFELQLYWDRLLNYPTTVFGGDNPLFLLLSIFTVVELIITTIKQVILLNPRACIAFGFLVVWFGYFIARSYHKQLKKMKTV